MSQLGFGVMLHRLGGGSPKSITDYVGQIITAASLDNDELRLEFANGKKIRIWDDGQSCCERRYITCDDKPADLVGGVFKAAIVKPVVDNGEEEDDDLYGRHDKVFVEIATDKTSITLCTHNEHNGYYGGFGLSADEI